MSIPLSAPDAPDAPGTRNALITPNAPGNPPDAPNSTTPPTPHMLVYRVVSIQHEPPTVVAQVRHEDFRFETLEFSRDFFCTLGGATDILWCFLQDGTRVQDKNDLQEMVHRVLGSRD
ncbi:hypothetical protein P154DRAFT_540666 [Amniculicola lignicola CBS 123094]|uniref:Uncharacterized protein n=1 Tax=Amniculicola lignicola CBS 123094 TaxID=1392246 RepID=A0A6A5VZ53_9PLEO|nr:hypothetical protein P154DRAFT_540666 [Amniculicola lignicola CBS 123094]